ncbi:MAG: metalloregulator ArsR/SmtB family transcription factor [Acidobacteria bacterium]|nr:metalloregulator ArsR/SmtB family transcription factor [Acidobacteriota bacterium]
MVNNEVVQDTAGPELDLIFGALADSTRRQMLFRLARGSATIGELGSPFGITKGAVTKHIKVLERSGLLKRDVQGRIHRCEIDPASLNRAERWVELVRADWEGRFDTLSDYLEEMKAAEPANQPTAARKEPGVQ